MSLPLLEIEKLSFGTRDGKLLCAGVQAQLRASEMLWISGPNGVGKTTFLNVILGMERPRSGRVKLAIPAKQIAYLPQLQNTAFHLPLTLRDVLEVSANRRLRDEEITPFGLLTPEQLNLAWNSASGGERKKTLLTSALLSRPKLLVLDEPMNHLDRRTQAQVESAILHYLEAGAVILVSHLPALGDEMKGASGRIRELKLVPARE